MKHAIQSLVLAGALCACGDQYANTLAAARESEDRRLPSIDELEREEAASESTAPTPVAVDPTDIDTRDTSPQRTDATFAGPANPNGSSNKDKDSAAMNPPGAIPPHTPGATDASKPGSSNAVPQDAAKGLGPSDMDFVSKAILGGLFDVQSSELAVSQATTPFVREFAQMMIVGHGEANRDLEKLARRKGGVVPVDLDEEYQSRLSTLRDQQGVNFDRQYHDMQVTAHKDAIALFDRASANCEDDELKAYATKVLPTLREHQKKLNEMPPTNGG